MVQNLTGSLALVTCKEPLRVSIVNHLGALLDQASASIDRPLIELACGQGIVFDLYLSIDLSFCIALCRF
jgi:hypothetical protein